MNVPSSLSPRWSRLLEGIEPDLRNAARRLSEVAELARTRFCFPPDLLADLNAYLVRLTSDPAALRNWDAVHAVFFGPDAPDFEIFDEPLPPELGGAEPYSFLLTVALAGLREGEAFFRAGGVPSSRLDEALADLLVWTKNCRANYRVTGLGFDHGFAWMIRLYRAQVLRFGRLEYNRGHAFGDILIFRHRRSGERMILFNARGEFDAEGRRIPAESAAKPAFRTDIIFGIFGSYTAHPIRPDGSVAPESVTLDLADWECVLRPADDVLYIHLPAGDPLTPESVCASLRQVLAFHAWPGAPDFHPRAVLCWSWLLDPLLEKLLPPTSRLVQFQKLGHRLPPPDNSSNNQEVIRRVFGALALREGIRPEMCRSSLQKAMASFLSSGGISMGGRIVFFPEDFSA